MGIEGEGRKRRKRDKERTRREGAREHGIEREEEKDWR